jgi:threonylcarbamoyladenosine tRNA methylthiotransferase MtaB
MRRRYNVKQYEDLIYNLNEMIPNIGIGVDVITGFPGETDEHFENTWRFLEGLPISYLHVFGYSERNNTHAVKLPGKVEITKRKKRSLILRELSAKKRYDFFLTNSGETLKVLFEAFQDDGSIYGFTDNYIRVKMTGNKDLVNKIAGVKLSVPSGSKFCTAELINN